GQNMYIFLTEATVSSLFVEKGQKVQLDVPGYAECKEKIDSKALFFWEFNPVGIVVTYSTLNTVVFPKYKGRVNFSEGNLSLLLENVQEGDSGSYTAVLSGDYDSTVAAYLISVQGRVEPPVLTVDSSTNGTCNVTVTCRGQNTTVTSICNSSTCSQVGGGSSGAETSTVSLLSIYVAGDSIICNHSNQVSWANDNKEIALICLSGPELKWEKYLLITAIPATIILPIIIILIIYFLCRKRNKSKLTSPGALSLKVTLLYHRM
uniref:Immunoglobulin subtype domain-containing protein n=1 Tax=Esox lucius TaxID=8010 RepID=A0A3P8Y8D0_ESOLU